MKRDVGFMTSKDGLELESYPYHLRGLSRPCLASGEASLGCSPCIFPVLCLFCYIVKGLTLMGRSHGIKD